MSSMRNIRDSKLLKDKSAVSVEEAAQLLTRSFGEPYKESDLLELVLNGKLVLSVNFLSGVFGKLCTINNIEFARLLNAGTAAEIVDVNFYLGELLLKLKFEDRLDVLPDICDLIMLFGGRDVVSQRYRELIGHPESELDNTDEILVVDDSGQIFRLHESFAKKDLWVDSSTGELTKESYIYPSDFGPRFDLNKDCELVIRTSVLCEFEAKHSGEDVRGLGEVNTEPPVANKNLSKPKEKKLTRQSLGKIEKSNTHIIGGLIDLLLNNGDKVPLQFKDEPAIIKALADRCGGLFGTSAGTLNGRFEEVKNITNTNHLQVLRGDDEQYVWNANTDMQIIRWLVDILLLEGGTRQSFKSNDDLITAIFVHCVHCVHCVEFNEVIKHLLESRFSTAQKEFNSPS